MVSAPSFIVTLTVLFSGSTLLTVPDISSPAVSYKLIIFPLGKVFSVYGVDGVASS